MSRRTTSCAGRSWNCLVQRHLPVLLFCVLLLLGLPDFTKAIYVTLVPGFVYAPRQGHAVLRWSLDSSVSSKRPISVINSQDVELVSSVFGMTRRNPAYMEIASRMELTLSTDRRTVEVVFSDVQDTDDGWYTLSIAKTDDPGVSSVGRLLVYYAPEWRGTRSRTVYARPGEKNVTLNCSVAANPPALFSWEYAGGSNGGEQGTQPRRHTSTTYEGDSEFSWIVIDEVSNENFGTYTCTAKNFYVDEEGSRHNFVSRFNVTLEHEPMTSVASVAMVLVPVCVVIALIILLVCCVRQYCAGRRTSSLRQKKTTSNGNTARNEDDPDSPLNPDEMQLANGQLQDKECHSMPSSPLLSSPYYPHYQYAPQGPVRVPPVTLPAGLTEENGPVGTASSQTSLHSNGNSAIPTSRCDPPNYFAMNSSKFSTQPVRVAPVLPPSVPKESTKTLPPVRNAPVAPASLATVCSASSPVNSQGVLTPTSSQNHSSVPSRNNRNYNPVKLTDPLNNDVPPAPVRNGNLNFAECSRTGMLLNSAGSSVNGSSSNRRRSCSSSSEDEVVAAAPEKDKPLVDSAENHDAKLNNNNTLTAPEVIYADVTVHASMGEDKIIGAKEESNYVSIDFNRTLK